MKKEILHNKIGFQYAWVIFLSVSILLMLVSLSYIIFGHSIEPQANMAVQEISQISPRLGHFVSQILRVFGLSWFAWGFLSAMISATVYKKGEMWAWYAFWILPIYEIGDGLIDYLAGGTTWLIPMIIALFLIVILLLSPQSIKILRKERR